MTSDNVTRLTNFCNQRRNRKALDTLVYEAETKGYILADDTYTNDDNIDFNIGFELTNLEEPEIG